MLNLNFNNLKPIVEWSALDLANWFNKLNFD